MILHPTGASGLTGASGPECFSIGIKHPLETELPPPHTSNPHLYQSMHPLPQGFDAVLVIIMANEASLGQANAIMKKFQKLLISREIY